MCNFVQTKNPNADNWVMIDMEKGEVVGYGLVPYRYVPIISRWEDENGKEIKIKPPDDSFVWRKLGGSI